MGTHSCDPAFIQNNDVDMISQSMNQSIGNLVSAVALFFVSLIMMFKTNVIMTLTAVIATMIGFGLRNHIHIIGDS